MAEIANVSLTHELKLFGHRCWELAAKLDPAKHAAPSADPLRQAAAEAPRRMARAAASEGRRATRELHLAFRAVSRAVEILDRVAREEEGIAVDALALAQEGAELVHSVFEQVA